MTGIAELKPCPTCGRVWACMTGTAAQISGMILCPKCYGRTGQIDLDCPVCGGNGLDPESFRGCCECGEENDPEEEQLWKQCPLPYGHPYSLIPLRTQADVLDLQVEEHPPLPYVEPYAGACAGLRSLDAGRPDELASETRVPAVERVRV